jgi:nicotinamidase-related amidase
MPPENLPSSRKGVALLVIDVQKGLFGKSTPIYHAEQLLDNICSLIDRAHCSTVPVFFIQHSTKNNLIEGSDDWLLHPRLIPEAADPVIQKHHGSAFECTSLGRELEGRDIGTIIVTGLVTHGCVKATCLDAHRIGYRVILARDGHSNFHKQAEQVIAEWNEKLGDGIVELKSTGEIDFRGGIWY